MKEAIKKADVLIEALPYIKKFHNKLVVIKYGGSILERKRSGKGYWKTLFFKFYGDQTCFSPWRRP